MNLFSWLSKKLEAHGLPSNAPSADYEKIKETIAEGKLGKPYLGAVSLRLNRSPAYYAAASWRGAGKKTEEC
ncbi:hypothetical protein QKW52_03345 [Bacillus sonorensis]|nr:hypothetical protein [Bacillus sonorensis]